MTDPEDAPLATPAVQPFDLMSLYQKLMHMEKRHGCRGYRDAESWRAEHEAQHANGADNHDHDAYRRLSSHGQERI
jgi:hypothetical protein